MWNVGNHVTPAVILLLAATSPALGYIKCYCNLPECTGDGNICTSYMDFCFSRIHMKSAQTPTLNTSESVHDVHGCLENLPQSDAFYAQTCDGTGVAVRQTPGGSPLLYCCSGHMCNYEEKPQSEEKESAKYMTHASTESSVIKTSHISQYLPQYQKETVLQVAVIAVPAAGSLILIILIVLAVKMLRDDQRSADSEQEGFKKSFGFSPYFNLNTKSAKKFTKHKQSQEVGSREYCEPLNLDLTQASPLSSIAGAHSGLLTV